MNEATSLEPARRAHPADKCRSRPPQLAALALCAVALSIRLWEIGIPSLWGDEAWTAAAASLPLAEGYQLVLGDGVHPPFYYLILQLVAPLGLCEWLLRWPSALSGTLAVALIYRLAQTVWSDRVAFIAALLATVHPYAVWYSQEARQYSLVIALAAGVMLAFVRFHERTKPRWLTFTLVSMFAYLTHYFLLLLALVQFLFLVTSFRLHYAQLRPWVAAQVIAAAPLALWVALCLGLPERNLGIGWIHRPDLAAIPETLWKLFFNAPLPAPWKWSGWAIAITAAWMVFRREPGGWSPGRSLVGMWLAVPIVAVWLISQSRPFYSDRFFVICLPATLLLLAAGLDSMEPSWAGHGLVLGLTVLSIWAILQVHGPRHPVEDWRQVGEWLY